MVTVIEHDADVIHADVEVEGDVELKALKFGSGSDIAREVRNKLGLDDDFLVFEREKDEPLAAPVVGRKNLRLVVHRARAITVTVQYEHRSEARDFAPSATIFKVLKWAVSKQGFNLDPTIAAKANLMLPGAEQPLPRDRAIAAYTPAKTRHLTVDLTLRDFTNG